MIISGLNRGAPKDFMNGSLAATSSSGEQRAQRARQQEFYTCYYRSGSVRHTWRHNSSPIHRAKQPTASCDVQPAAHLQDGHDAKPRPPNPTDTMDSTPFTYPGKLLDPDLIGLQDDGTWTL